MVYDGFLENVQLGESITAPALIYIKTSDGKAYKVVATDLTKGAQAALLVSGSSGDFRQAHWGSAIIEWPAPISPGGTFYLSDTAGAITTTAPTNVQVVGHATADGLFAMNIAPFASSGGGGVGGSDYLGTGFTSGGGSGTIPDGTVATCDGEFEIVYPNTNGSVYSLKSDFVPTNGQADDFTGLIASDESVMAGVGRYLGDEGELSFMSFAALGDRLSEFIQSPYFFQIAARTADFSQNGVINLFPTAASLSVGGTSLSLDESSELSYGGDYSATIITNDRSIPDVGTVKLLATKVYSGTKTATGTATTTFTVTIGTTQADANYKVTTEGGNALSSAIHYVNNKTTTTFDVVYLAGLTGAVAFDWILTP